jgi:protein-disulfide isomerase
MRGGNSESGRMFKKAIFTLAAGAAVALVAPVMVAAAPANWLQTFTQSAEGGHIIGNPAAATKVVEYASYTCSHCKQFETDDAPLLKSNYVAKGKTSFEIRNLVRDPLDLTVAMLARCGGKGRFFGNHRHFMATQSQWMAKAQSISTATEALLQTENYAGFMVGAYREMGLGAFAKQRGITEPQALTCLKDPVALQKILAMTDKAVGPLKIEGTPAFLVNGKVVHAHDLAELRAHLPK